MSKGLASGRAVVNASSVERQCRLPRHWRGGQNIVVSKRMTREERVEEKKMASISIRERDQVYPNGFEAVHGLTYR